jgi:hypothetical protein
MEQSASSSPSETGTVFQAQRRERSRKFLSAQASVSPTPRRCEEASEGAASARTKRLQSW